MRGGRLKQKLSEDEALLGPFIMLPCPGLVEICGLAGFDFVIIDAEHGPHDTQGIEHVIRAADAVDLPAIVRVHENSVGVITRALDAGASGICVPHVVSAAAAATAVQAAKFAPVGLRGFNDASRSGRYMFSGPDYCARANEETVLIVQIEDVEGVANVEAILDVAGVDLVFIGPYDLSQSAGKTGQVDDPEVEAMMRRVAEACVARKRPLGIYADTPEGTRKWMAAGARLFATGTDSVIFAEGCRRQLAELRAAARKPPLA